MTREDLLALHAKLNEEGLKVMEAKNRDYGADDDPFRNFHEFGLLGILVRLSDKLARLRTFTERGELTVKDESVTDTIIDARNYLVLFEGYRRRSDYGILERSPLLPSSLPKPTARDWDPEGDRDLIGGPAGDGSVWGGPRMSGCRR